MDVDTGEKKAENKEGSVSSISPRMISLDRLQPDTAVFKPHIPCKLHSLPGAATRTCSQEDYMELGWWRSS